MGLICCCKLCSLQKNNVSVPCYKEDIADMYFAFFVISIFLVFLFFIFKAIRSRHVISDLRAGCITHSAIRKMVYKRFFRIALIIVCLSIGIFFIASKVIGGPSVFRVMTAAKRYLSEQYGSSNKWSISIKKHVDLSEEPPAGYYIIEYRYNDHAGMLKAKHTDCRNNRTFNFEEYETPDNSKSP